MIEPPVEAKAPRVFVRGMTDGQETRIRDWVRSQEALAELVERAQKLADEASGA